MKIVVAIIGGVIGAAVVLGGVWVSSMIMLGGL